MLKGKTGGRVGRGTLGGMRGERGGKETSPQEMRWGRLTDYMAGIRQKTVDSAFNHPMFIKVDTKKGEK